MQPHQPDQLHLLLQFRFRHGLEFPDGVVHALGSHLAGGKFHFPCANEFFNHAVFLPHRIQAFPDDGLAALGNGQLAPGLVQGTEKIQFRLAEGPEVRLLVLFRHLFFQGLGRPVTGMVKPRLPDMLSVFSWRTCSISQEKDGSFHQPDCLAASLLEASFRRALFRSGFMTRPIWRAWFRVTEMCVSTRDASFQEASSAFRSMGAL